MNIGQYFIDAGILLSLFFKTGPFSQIAAFLTEVGSALIAGTGSVGPITVGNETLTITIAPKT